MTRFQFETTAYGLKAILLATLALQIVPALVSQTIDTATVSAQVLDTNRAPLQGVQITVRNSRNGSARTGVTDAAGRFSFSGLPPGGGYRLSASKPGFADVAYPHQAKAI